MSFTDEERASNLVALEWFLAMRRPPKEIRAEVDVDYSVEGHVVDLFEIRPYWDDKTRILNLPFARIRYVRTRDEWNLYWMRADGKWYSYPPSPTHASLMDAVKEVNADQHCCFFG